MTADPPEVRGPATRTTALVLARLHLRTGALALARTELETMAGRDLLDDDGVLDLAEVRWRTGDLAGAGEAVAALIGDVPAGDPPDDPGPPIAWVIAAEAAAARGRPTEARGHAERLRRLASNDLDAIFAGLPRSTAWPADPLVPVPDAATLFPPGTVGRQADRSSPPPRRGPEDVVSVAGARGGAPDRSDTTPPTQVEGFWDAEAGGGPGSEASPDDASGQPAEPAEIDPELAAVAEAIAATEEHATGEPGPDEQSLDDQAPDASRHGLGGTRDTDPVDGLDVPGLPDGLTSLEAGRAALEAGRTDAAAVHLGLALRSSPALAPAVLHAIGERDDRALAFTRGDAYRLVGREREAMRAYAALRPPAPSHTAPSDDGDDEPSDPDPPPSPQGDPA